MHDYRLNETNLEAMRATHRAVRDRCEAYRLNAVILLGQGRSAPDVVDALLLDPETVRTLFKQIENDYILISLIFRMNDLISL